MGSKIRWNILNFYQLAENIITLCEMSQLGMTNFLEYHTGKSVVH
jgi:hypothetical protein